MQGEKEGKDKAKEKEKEKEKERVAKLAALFGAKAHTIEQDEQSSIEDTKVLFLFLFFFLFLRVANSLCRGFHAFVTPLL